MLRKLFIILFLFFSTFIYGQDHLFMYSNKYTFVDGFKIKNKVLPDTYTYSLSTFKLTKQKFYVFLPNDVIFEYDIVNSKGCEDHLVIQSTNSIGNSIFFLIYEHFLGITTSREEGMWIFMFTENID